MAPEGGGRGRGVNGFQGRGDQQFVFNMILCREKSQLYNIYRNCKRRNIRHSPPYVL